MSSGAKRGISRRTEPRNREIAHYARKGKLQFFRHSYCEANTPTQPLVPSDWHSGPAPSGTKMWLVLGSAATLWEKGVVGTFCSHCLERASMTPRTGLGDILLAPK